MSDSHPPYLYPPYRSTPLRAPSQPLVVPKYGPDAIELSAPVFGEAELGLLDNDLTKQHAGEPLGERIVVTGRVLDADGRPVPHTLVETAPGVTEQELRDRTDPPLGKAS